ncbi:hypothetical protein JB92DRAFT_2704662 [Gautieria morchelliformis]|nr:hypothetical protein JB92DRAFT_2704662 [Gautieria morchelliformis]
MGFLTRFFSLGGKSKRKNRNNDQPKKNAGSFSTPRLLPLPQDQEVVENRLLRSSSTHFSILSETEYRSLPPIPHPINNVLRAPSIMSSATQRDTYTVTIHRRMLHSRTVFPNANRSGSHTPSGSPNRRHSSPQLTPGEKNRLLRLKQDTSVLSLLNIYDDAGRPDPQAFSNTPVRRGHTGGSLRVLLGSPSPPRLSTSKTSAEESDISWADRRIR